MAKTAERTVPWRASFRFEDGGRVSLRLLRGYFLWEVPPRRWRAGRLPEAVVARDEAGKVIARTVVRRLG